MTRTVRRKNSKCDHFITKDWMNRFGGVFLRRWINKRFKGMSDDQVIKKLDIDYHTDNHPVQYSNISRWFRQKVKRKERMTFNKQMATYYKNDETEPQVFPTKKIVRHAIWD